jgi:hypothetical protein
MRTTPIAATLFTLATPFAANASAQVPNIMTCTQPQMKVDAAIKFQGEKAYTFASLATVSGPDGKSMSQKSTGSGKWLGSDCGKIKPASDDE